MRSYGLAMILGISVLGCETTVDVDLALPAPQLVVDARFEEGRPWHVVVQRAVATNERVDDYPVYVEHATVTIDGDDGTHAQLAHRGGGFYAASSAAPAAGVTYRLTVEADGFPLVEASDRIPENVTITHSAIGTPAGLVRRQIEVEVQDPREVANFYELYVLDDADWSLVPFSLRNPELEEQVRSLDVFDLYEPSKSPILERAVVHDGPFNGRTFRFLIETVPGYAGGGLTVHVRALSKSAFAYEHSRLRQEASTHNPFVEPVPVRTNVRGGQGVFAGAATQTVGAVTPAFMLQAIATTFTLRRYYSEGGEFLFDYVFNGSTGTLELGTDFSATGSVLLVPRSGAGEPRQIVLDGGFTLHGNVVHLYHSTNTALRDMALQYHPGEQTLTGSLSATAAVRVTAQFGHETPLSIDE